MAGAGFKTFASGEVLTAANVNTYLMQQTVMVFADSSARSTALGANVSEGMLSYLKDTNQVEVYNGSAWVASDDPNAIQNTIVDAKGDLICATAADTPARLAVGANDTVLTADSSTATGLKWAAAAGGGLTLLSTTTLSGTTTSITSISGAYKNLYIEIENPDAAADFFLNIRFNGSSTAHYYNKSRSNSTSFFNAQNTQLNYFDNSFDNGNQHFASITIFNYASTTTKKTFMFQAHWVDLSAATYSSVGGGGFNSNSAITSLDITSDQSLTAGTVRIYGVK